MAGLSAELTDIELAALGSVVRDDVRRSAHEWIADSARALPNGSFDDGRRIISAGLSAGLIIEENGNVSFTHQVFADQLLAMWLAFSLLDDSNNASTDLIAIASNPRWHNILASALVWLAEHSHSDTALDTLQSLRDATSADNLLRLTQLDKSVLARCLHYAAFPNAFESILPQSLEELFSQTYPGLHSELLLGVASDLGGCPGLQEALQPISASTNDVTLASLLTFCQHPLHLVTGEPIESTARSLLQSKTPRLRTIAENYLRTVDYHGDSSKTQDGLLTDATAEIRAIELHAHTTNDVTSFSRICGIVRESTSFAVHIVGISALSHLILHGGFLEELADLLVEERINSNALIDSLSLISAKAELAQDLA